MPSITIRNVPEETRNELAARAARAGQSLQEYLHGELVSIASKPDMATLMKRIRERKDRDGIEVSAEQILAWRDADRK
jgi:antitoxin FitA